MSLAPANGLPLPVDRKETVLVAVDEPLVRSVIASYLRDCEYEVIEAANPDEALVVLRQASVVIDVFFSDIEKSGSIGGPALVQWVQTHRPGIKVVLTSTIGE